MHLKRLGIVACVSASSASGQITGRVVDSLSGEPITGATIRVNAASVTSDSLGKFSISGIAAGRYTVTYRRLCYRPTTRPIEVPAGGRLNLLDVLVMHGNCDVVDSRTGRMTFAVCPSCTLRLTDPGRNALGPVRETRDSVGTLWHVCEMPASPRLDSLAASIHPLVEYAITGGWWTQNQNAREGQYRVLVFSGGFEHVVSQVYAQWIKAPKNDADTTIVFASRPVIEVNDKGLRVSGAPTMRGDTVFVNFIDPHVLGNAIVKRCAIVFAPPPAYKANCRDN